MKLFTPGHHRALHCDAYLVDTARLARPLRLSRLVDLAQVIEALLDRVVLMGRSVYAVRNRTFALFFEDRDDTLTVAVTEPFHDGVTGALRDVLGEHGPVHQPDDLDLQASVLQPLLAYERGAIAMFDTPATRALLPAAGRRGLRILACTTTREPDDGIEIGGVPVPAWLERQSVDEVALDLDAMAGLSDAEIDNLLDENLKDWDA